MSFMSAYECQLHGFFHGNYAGCNYIGDLRDNSSHQGSKYQKIYLYTAVLYSQSDMCRDLYLHSLTSVYAEGKEDCRERGCSECMGDL